MVFDAQASMSFPNEAPSGGAAVTGWPSPLMQVLYCLMRFICLENLQDDFSLTLMLSQNYLHLMIPRISTLLANLFEVFEGQEKNVHTHVCIHSLAGQHHCTSAVSMETRLKILNNGN